MKWTAVKPSGKKPLWQTDSAFASCSRDWTSYLELVDKLAAQAQIVLDQEELHRQALAWERFHASRTPRCALQFILSLT